MAQLVAVIADARLNHVPYPARHVIELRAELALGANHNLRGGGRRGRAQVGYEVADGEVGLVSDRGDRRDGAVSHRARHRLFVEGPQVFERTSSAADQKDVVQLPEREVADGDGDLTRRIPSLYPHGIHLHVKAGETPAENVQYVANGGAGRTGDDGDPLRQHRDRFFSGRVEQPLIGELLFQLFERQLQCSQTGRLHRHGVELKLSLLLVKGQPSADDELQSVLDAEAKEARIRGKKDHAHLRAGIFDRKIEMAGSGSYAVRGLAFDAYVVVSKELYVDLTDELTYVPDALCHSLILDK